MDPDTNDQIAAMAWVDTTKRDHRSGRTGHGKRYDDSSEAEVSQ